MAKKSLLLKKDVPKLAQVVCERMLKDLEAARRPILEATKCSLDNSFYNPRVGFLTPGDKKVRTELNVSSVQKMSRAIFMLEILLRNIKTGMVNTKRELYYISKGEVKSNPALRALDFEEQTESDSIVDFICEMFEVYREEMNCFANDRGGQTYSKQLVVTETLPNGEKAVVDLGSLGTTPFQPKNWVHRVFPVMPSEDGVRPFRISSRSQCTSLAISMPIPCRTSLERLRPDRRQV
jgi:DNA topoisomerase-6 subunit A